MLINWTKILPGSISDLDHAEVFNLECLLLGAEGITVVMNHEQSKADMKCI